MNANNEMASKGKTFIDAMYRRITLKAHPHYSHPTAFICESDLKQIWSEEEDIKNVLDCSDDHYVKFVKENLLPTLSTLILIDASNLKRTLNLLCPSASHQRTDYQFPFPKQDLGCLDIQHRDHFYEKQYLFCPIVIENRPEAQIFHKDTLYRFPFMETESVTVGSGGYGDVRINKIAPQYYRDTRSTGPNMGNSEAEVVAYKVFPSRDAFQTEVKNLEFLKESLSAHKHIVLHLAAIVRGSDFYIFLPYTELGSLEVFFCKGLDGSNGTDMGKITYNFDEHFSSNDLQPVHMLKQMLNLCSALAFLHDPLQIGQSQMYCAHMDLRPQNVLVFRSESEPVGSWKISDFGISSFKEVHDTKEQQYLSIRDLAEKQTSAPTDRNIEGAHRSPESHGSHKEPYSGRKSDMWSYACILIEVLIFALGGKDLLSKFRKEMAQGDEGNSDAFFTVRDKISADAQEKEYLIKTTVVGWLHSLGELFMSDKPWIDDLVKLILATLKIMPRDRLRARQVTSHLERILGEQPSPKNLASSKVEQWSGPKSHERVSPHLLRELDIAPLSEERLDDSSTFRPQPANPKFPVMDRVQRRTGVWRSSLPGPSSSVKDWSMSPVGDRVAFLVKLKSYTVYIFSTVDGESNDATELTDEYELPSGIEWQTLKLANPYLSILGWHAKSGTQVKLLNGVLVACTE
ncbi:MAG: hypothetical protein Q9218_001835 [Villophora microphyllina]